jgi:Mg2+-importing ATPase
MNRCELAIAQGKPEKTEDKKKDLLYYAASPLDNLYTEFCSSLNGLSEREAKARLKQFGPNEPSKRKKPPFFSLLFSKFTNPLVIILIIIALFSVFFGERISAAIVSLIILLSVILSFSQEYRSEKAVEKLNTMVRSKVIAIRAGKSIEMNLFELVPGDIVELDAGDMIPADLRIVQSKDLFINQAALTGESFPVEKFPNPVKAEDAASAELTNIAYMGSSVVSGQGKALVIKTGEATQFGDIARSIYSRHAETAFDRGIKQFTVLMIKFMLVLVVAIFVIILFFKGGLLKEALLFSLAVAVGLTPEMLPMIVTINLSNGAMVMARKKVIVKRLNSIQNFGAMDILCTDKTGTLTMDRIMLEKYCDIKGRTSEDVLKNAYINSTYHTGLKNLLDKAILGHEKFKVDTYTKIDEIPFDFSRKIMSVVVEYSGRHRLIAKGAPEEIFKRCTKYELNGKTKPIHRKIFESIKKEYTLLGEEGFMVLALAYRDFKRNKRDFARKDEKNLILKGYIAFLDPPKPSAKKTLTSLRELGVEVKILTGDNEVVTRKICNEVGLEIKGILIGDTIEKLNPLQLKQIVEHTTIFARVSPLQKQKIIEALSHNDHVVGYLGDGINDSPSLKASDVGISVNNAVDIAKESADIILLEKELTVLTDGVLEGRKTYSNTIKYIKMGASSNFGNMLSMAGATLFLPFLPMLPIQILLNNFLYDLSNVSIPTDEVDKEDLSRPRPWKIEFIKKFMLSIGPLSSIYDFLTFGVMWFLFQGFTQTETAQALFHTGWFFESLCTQVLIIYIIRTNRLPFIESRPSKYLLITTILVLLAAIGIIYSPVGLFFGFVPLPPLFFGILSLMVLTYMVLVQLVKQFIIRKLWLD